MFLLLVVINIDILRVCRGLYIILLLLIILIRYNFFFELGVYNIMIN